MADKFKFGSFLNKDINKLKIAVIGDVMLDRYYYGAVSRISPEAPVPVNKVRNETLNIGGAGNVAANLAGLGVNVSLAALCGDDDDGHRLAALLKKSGIDDSGIIYGKNRSTIAKLRVIGANQQMLRLDFEKIEPVSDDETEKTLLWLDKLLAEGIDGVILSDYAKGFLTEAFCHRVIDILNKANVPVLVDPKGYEWEKYKNAGYITPNVKELGEAVKRTPLNDTAWLTAAAREAIEFYQVKSVMVTRSEKGMTFISPDKEFTADAAALEVYDVSGAGDTVAAVFLAAIAGGFTENDAAYLANEAAGIVVGRAGTYAIKKDELLSALLEKIYRQNKKRRPLSWEEIATLTDIWHRMGQKIVFTNGCFDILHPGHVTYLEKAAELGDKLIVGLNTDSSVKKLKGVARPVVEQTDRARILSALGCVDAVVLFAEDTPTDLIKLIKPDILVKGGDYRAEDVAGREHAGEVMIIDFEEGYSTTDIVERIAQFVREGKI